MQPIAEYKKQIAALRVQQAKADKLKRQAEIDYIKATKRARVVEDSWTLVISGALLVASVALLAFY